MQNAQLSNDTCIHNKHAWLICMKGTAVICMLILPKLATILMSRFSQSLIFVVELSRCSLFGWRELESCLVVQSSKLPRHQAAIDKWLKQGEVSLNSPHYLLIKPICWPDRRLAFSKQGQAGPYCTIDPASSRHPQPSQPCWVCHVPARSATLFSVITIRKELHPLSLQRLIAALCSIALQSGICLTSNL